MGLLWYQALLNKDSSSNAHGQFSWAQSYGMDRSGPVLFWDCLQCSSSLHLGFLLWKSSPGRYFYRKKKFCFHVSKSLPKFTEVCFKEANLKQENLSLNPVVGGIYSLCRLQQWQIYASSSCFYFAWWTSVVSAQLSWTDGLGWRKHFWGTVLLLQSRMGHC